MNDLYEKAGCIFCNQEVSPKRLYKFNNIGIYKCTACDFTFINPRLKEAAVKEIYLQPEYYESDSSSQGYNNYLNNKSSYQKTFAKRLKNILKHKNGGKILDIGCGPGFFLEIAEAHGFKGWGIDLSPYAIAYARKTFSERIIQGYLTRDMFPENHFDVIVAFDVFEHLYNPDKFLSITSKILKNDGIIMITTPNIKSLLSIFSRGKWVSFKLPEHIYYYSPQTLRRVVKNYYSVKKISSAGQFCSLEFIAEHMGNLNRPVGKLMKKIIYFLNIHKWNIYINSGSMTAILIPLQQPLEVVKS